MQPILQLIDIQTFYGKSQALWGVSLRMERGSVAAIMGRNGMGKTTIIHSIIGFTPASRGRVIIKGKEVTQLKPNQTAKMGVALVPQGRRIFPSLSVEENLTAAARGAKGPDTWSLEKVYSLYPVLKKRRQYKGTLLSGGEQQMLCIGRALMTNPDLILMDEPSEGLAPLIVQELGTTIKELNNSGLSILLVEQNINLALTVADHVYVVNQGMIVHESTPGELKKNETVMDEYIGVSKRAP